MAVATVVRERRTTALTLEELLERDHVPEPEAVVLDGLTLQDLPWLEKRDGVEVIYTRGVGKHYGKRYVRLRFETPVKVGGRVYVGAESDPLDMSAGQDAKFNFHVSIPHECEFSRRRRERFERLEPETVRRANAVLAALREVEPGFDCSAEHALQLAEVLEEKATRIWNQRLNRLLHEVFGIMSYKELRELYI